jgi:8-oxo-dGTP pyrophosphatase MutT (NUDIX family)
MKRNPWKTISSQIVYQNPWLRVREDAVIRPDGNPGIYGVVEIRPSVGVIAINDREEIALAGQWRYTLDRYSYEIVRGGSEPGETDFLNAARRELREEAGVEARHWQSLGAVDVCNGVTTDVQHLFLATGLSVVGAENDPFEEIETLWQSLPDVLRMIRDGEMTEVCSVAAILKYDALRQSGIL